MKNIPDFPNFIKFSADLRGTYLNFYKNFDPYSDFSFSNLMVWLDLNNDLEIAIDSGNIILKFSDPLQGNQLSLSILGKKRTLESINHVLNYEKDMNYKQEIVMLPESVIKNEVLNEKKLIITNDLDNREYIFSVNDTHNLIGNKYEKFRHKINNFYKCYHNNLEYRDLNISDYSVKKLIINGMHVWDSTSRIDKNDELNVEGLAIDRYIRISDQDCRCIGIFIGGRLEAFSLYNLPPQHNYAIGEHIKCNYNFKYIFDFAYYCTINKLFSQNIKYINGEQDLGIPGLRIHKKELNPIGYLKVYKITTV